METARGDATSAATPPIASPIVTFRLPLAGARVLSPFGRRRRGWHTGIDLRRTRGGGDPVTAAADGVVEKTRVSGRGYGRMVLLRHADGWATRYAHLRRILVKPGQTVSAGETLGIVGGTGRATAPHLHFEIIEASGKPVNPAPWIFPENTHALTRDPR